ncbi:MAG: penicillin-binding protein activator, partial [Gammaproteobacteria bacterium]|nr:penicillin-binding protein activator [Gammaproteobacteria bacterium]
SQPPRNQLRGWRELAHISKSYLNRPQLMKQKLKEWRRLYPQHPAIDDMYKTLVERKIEQPIQTEQIAVLLPLTGRYSAAGNAIRDGLLAAYYAARAKGESTQVRFYDTASTADINVLYDQAIADGSKVVLGPLRRDKVTSLYQRGEFTVPTIALNYTELDQTYKNFFQFSLSPEDEVKQVAERMWRDGYNSVALISPQGGWGDRLLTAFEKRWKEYNNVELDIYRYDEKNEGIANSIKRVLNIDTSKQRVRDLRRVLGRGIKYSERRRKDIDVIFVLGVSNKDAAQIRPQLKYFGADELPVYATSQIYSLSMNRRMTRDMDGILFSDMPWMLGTSQGAQGLRQALNKSFSIEQSPNIRLYAFGVDAYRVLPILRNLQLSPFERYEGATGYLHVNKQRHIERELEWAFFNGGEVQPITELVTEPES